MRNESSKRGRQNSTAKGVDTSVLAKGTQGDRGFLPGSTQRYLFSGVILCCSLEESFLRVSFFVVLASGAIVLWCHSLLFLLLAPLFSATARTGNAEL